MSVSVLAEAQRLAGLGSLDEAAALLEQQLAEGPDYEALCLSAVVEFHRGRKHPARTRLLQAIDAEPERPEAYASLAELLAAGGEPGRAEGFYQLACQAAGDDPAALNDLLVFYQEQGLPYSAKRIALRSLELDPDQPVVEQQLAELNELFPDRDVTLYIPCYNASRFIDRVLPAALGQTYPLSEVLVIDDGSTDDTVELAAKYPIRIITIGTNKGLANARNTALLATRTSYLANVDADVVADPHWLERLMLQFESERLARAGGDDTGAPLGGVTGRLDELNDVWLADQWRTVHMGQHHGDEPLAEVPHIYGCNGVYLRDAIFRAGGYDERYRTNGEDCDAAERVRGLGYRLAYDPHARCSHLRQDDLPSVLRTIWRYHTPYPEHRAGWFATGEVRDLLQKLPLNVARYGEDLNLDSQRRAWHLLYPTFLGLPWRVLMDFKLGAASCPPEKRRTVEETQASIYLGLFSLLREFETREDVLRLIHDDLAPCLPEDPDIAAVCSWENVQIMLAGGAEPLRLLPERDADALSEVLRAMSEVWLAFDQTNWNMIRASGLRLLHEEEYRARLRSDAPRVAVINPPWAEDGRIGVRAGSRWPFTQDAHGQRVPGYVPFPFFLATAAALLKQESYPTLIVDAIAEGLYTEEFLRRLEGFAPDIVLMETATASHEIDLDWALRLKERLGDGVKVVLCGPHATALGREILDEAPMADGVVLGEYEPTFLEMVRALDQGRSWHHCPGLLWRDESREVHVQTTRGKLPDMSFYPWPERDTLPMYNYFDSFANAMPWPNVQMHASRGCPFSCIFCVWPQVVYEGKQYRTRDNDDIVAEMSWLVERFGFLAVYFDDDTFNIDNDRIIDLCNKIADAGHGVPICAMARADTSSREAFEAMKRAGLVGIKFGVETGDAEMMKRIKKHLDLDRVRQSVAWCKELGIGVHLTFSFGGPGETRETAEKTIRLALDLDPESLQFSLMTPFPGTVMFRDAVQNGTLLTTDWKQFDGARYTVVQGEHLTREELEGLLDEAHFHWLLHLADRAALGVIGGNGHAPERVSASVPELAELPDESLDLVQLVTPLEELAAPAAANGLGPRMGALLGRQRGLHDALGAGLAKLRPGGCLTVARGGCESLPVGWSDNLLTEWAQRNGVEVLGTLAGFNGELAMVLQRPVETPAAACLAAQTLSLARP